MCHALAVRSSGLSLPRRSIQLNSMNSRSSCVSPLVFQSSVNEFAGVDEILGLFTNIKHGGTPFEEEDKECGKGYVAWQGPTGKDIGHVS